MHHAHVDVGASIVCSNGRHLLIVTSGHHRCIKCMVVLTAEKLITLACFTAVFRIFRRRILLLLRQEISLVLH